MATAYSSIIEQEPDGFIAHHPTVGRSCKAQGNTPSEAIKNLEGALADYRYAMDEFGLPMPAGDVAIAITLYMKVDYRSPSRPTEVND